MATLEKAEELEQRVMINAGEKGAEALMRLPGTLSKLLLAAGAKGGQYIGGKYNDLHDHLQNSIDAFADGMRERAHEKKWGSEVTVKEFSDTVEGKREIVDVDDDELVDEVRQELRKHGVTFAVERDEEGQHYLHVRGNDASLIAHALERAQERLDGRRLNQEITELGQAAAWVEKQEAPANEKRAELRNSADYLKASPEEQAEMSTQLESSLAADAQQRIDTNSRGQVPPKVLEAEERGLRGMDVAVELREQAQTLAREGTPPRGAERDTPQQETGTPDREAPQREEAAPEHAQAEDRSAPTADDLDVHEEDYLNGRREGLDHKGTDLPEGYATPAVQEATPELNPMQQEASLPEGYEGRTAPAPSQTAPASDRAARAPERSPAPRRDDKNDRGGHGPGSPSKDRPKLADHREQSKASVREKIGKLSDRLKQGTGAGALTPERKLGAHKKGPTR